MFRDLLELSLIENRSAARNLLRLLAFQVGNLVNISELANKLSIDAKTVRRYLTLFEQSFIVFTLPPYTRNGRKEIGKMAKIYFFDCGLRNALIDNFQPMESRADQGALFENLVISEVYKSNIYGGFGYALHFWRTRSGVEVDFIVYGSEGIFAIEVKNSARVQPQDVKNLRAFKEDYPKSKAYFLYRGKERLVKDGVHCIPCAEFLGALRPGKLLC